MPVQFLRSFVGPQDGQLLREWILSLHAGGVLKANPQGPGRFHCPIYDAGPRPEVYERIKYALEQKYGIVDRCLDLSEKVPQALFHSTASFIGLQTEGGFVSPHIDSNKWVLRQLRCTVLVSKPEQGGALLLDRKEHAMEEGDIYSFVSNVTIHGTTPVQGIKPRMACSFGFLVEESFVLPTD